MKGSKLFALLLLLLMVLFIAVVPALAMMWQAHPATVTVPTSAPVTTVVPAVPVATQLTWSALVVFALQWLKNSPSIAFIARGKVTVLRALSALAAAGTAIGIRATFDAGTLTVTGLTWAVILPGLSHWLQQFIFQELIYRGAVANSSAIPTPAGKG